jgi:hypothetical protein
VAPRELGAGQDRASRTVGSVRYGVQEYQTVLHDQGLYSTYAPFPRLYRRSLCDTVTESPSRAARSPMQGPLERTSPNLVKHLQTPTPLNGQALSRQYCTGIRVRPLQCRGHWSGLPKSGFLSMLQSIAEIGAQVSRTPNPTKSQYVPILEPPFLSKYL